MTSDGGGPDETAALLGQMAQGNEVALGQLIELMGGVITGFALRYLGDRAEAEDVAQDVFLTAWNKAGAFVAAKGSARSWLFTIARNRSIDRMRRRRLRWMVGLDGLTGEPEDDAPNPADTTLARSELAAARREIEALPDRQRMALLLASVGELETPEIARIMGTGRGAVEQLLVRARRRLRERLGQIDEVSE